MARVITLDDNGELRVREAATNGANEVTIKAPASLAGDYDFILPTAAPGSTLFLTMDTSGQLATAAGATGTLNEAYDSGGAGNGRTIDVTDGALQLVGDASNDTLELKDATPSIVLTLTGVTNRNVRLMTGADTFSIQRGDDDGDGIGDTYDDVILIDTENRKVALGVATTPQSVLHVLSGSAGGATPNATALVTIEAVAGAPAVLQLLTEATQVSSILFGDQADDNIGYLTYDHTDDHLAIGVNTGDKLTILSTGYVGIGQTTPTTTLHVETADNYVAKFVSTDAYCHLVLEDNTTTANAVLISALGDTLELRSGGDGSVTLVCDENNRVGIGVSNPTSTLHVNSGVTDPSTGTIYVLHDGSNGAIEIIQSGAGAHIELKNSSAQHLGSWFGTTLQIGDDARDTNGLLDIQAGATREGRIYFTDGTTGRGRLVYDHSTDSMAFWTASSLQMTIDSTGNISLGSTSVPNNTSVSISLAFDTEPTTSATAAFYSVRPAATTEMKVIDSDGNRTTLSPHSFHRFPPSEKMAWCYNSDRDGVGIHVDMLRLARLVEQISGETLVNIYDVDGDDDPGISEPDWDIIPGRGTAPIHRIDKSVTSRGGN